MKLNFHFLPLTVRLVSYTPGRNSLPVERSLDAPETVREGGDCARFGGQTDKVTRMHGAKILRKPSDKDATQPLASVATDFGMRNLEKDLLEKFFRLLDDMGFRGFKWKCKFEFSWHV